MPLHNKIEQEIVTAISRVLFNAPTPAHNRIMNASRTAKGAITAITLQNGIQEMAMRFYRNP